MRHWALIALAYLAGSILFLWPMPVHLDSMIWGDRFDAWTTLWLIGHLAEGMEQGTLSPTTTEILYPLGYSLWSFGHMALQAIGALMVWAGLGVVSAYNCLLIAGIWTSAIAAHMLGREVTGSHVAGAVAGITFATSPYLYAEGAAGCIELVAAGLLPLHAWSLVRLMRIPSWRRCAAAAGILALIGPFNWYYTLFAGVFGLGFCAWQALRAGRRIRDPERALVRRGVGMIMLSMAVAALIDLPLIDAARQETPTRPSFSAELFSDPLAWDRSQEIADGTAPIEDINIARLEELDAMQVHLNSTSILGLVDAQFSVNPLGITPGNLAYAVGFLGLLLGRRRTRGWAILALGFTVLTLGPYLNPEGNLNLAPNQSHTLLPYGWFYLGIPMFSKAYRPYRFAVIVLQCLAVIGAIGAAVMVRHLGQRWAMGLTLMLGLIGFAQPHWAGEKPGQRSLMSTNVPTLYAELAAAPSGAVIELPLHYQPVSIATAKQQTHQLNHGHPMLNTNQLIRRPDLLAFQQFVAGNTVLNTMLDLGRSEPPLTIADADIAALEAQGFRYLVLHDEVTGDSQHLAGERAWADLVSEPARSMLYSIFGEPVIRTDSGMVFDLQTAELVDGRTRTWTGKNIEMLKPPFDTAETGFTLHLSPGDEVTLTDGQIQQISLWSRGSTSDSGNLILRAVGDDFQEEVPVELKDGIWSYGSIKLEESTSIRVKLVAGDEGAHAALTRMQVIR